MQKTILSKIIAVVLLLTLLVPTFGTTAYAVAGEVAANQENLKTSTRFVDANLAFIRNEEVLDYIMADVNDANLKLRLFLNIKAEGYFQGGQIDIRNPEDLTYEFVTPEKGSELIQSVEPYTVKLNQLQGVSETYIEIPIKYTGIDNVDAKTLLNKRDIEFSGEYVNAQGRKYDVYKRTSLTLNWIDKKEIEINNTVQKFIKQETPQGKEIVLQNLITVKNQNKEIILPIQKLLLETSLIKLENKTPKSVNVAIQKSSLFNDEEAIILDKEFYSWDKEKNLLKIEVKNAQNEDNTYSAGKGNLEILITSFYEIEKESDKYEGDVNVLVKQYVLTGDSKLIEIQKELKTPMVFDKEVGEIIDVDETFEINKMPKGILYVNSLATIAKDNFVKSKLKLDISNVNIIDSVRIVENEPQYNNKKIERNLIYKTIEINKKEFDNVFGEGYMDIYSDKQLVGRLDNKSLELDNKYIFEFKDPVSKINILTSKPIKEGEVFLELTRALGKASYNFNTLKDLKSLNINKKAYIVFNNEQRLLNNIKHTINLVDGSSNIVLNTNKTELSTIKKNENIEFVIALNNDKLLSDAYGQTAIELLLPKGIKDFKIKETNLMHGNGLKIASTKILKQGSQYLVQIALSGKQNGLSTGHLINGTNIVINTDITLDQWATTKEVAYQVKYSNTLATNYGNRKPWSMGSVFSNFAPYGNGVVQGKLKYIAPQGLVLINEFEKYNKKNDSVISINQGYQEGKLDVLSGKRVVDATIYLLNNSEGEATQPTILGRIPNKLNKNIFTGETLGSTFDMTLVKEIDFKNARGKVYYSSNPNATNDLKNVNNAWSEGLNLKDAKSYLIVLEDKLPKGKLIEFNYSLELPANLEHNQGIQTYSLVEYGVNTTKGNIRYYQMASPVGLSTGEGVQLNVDIKADKEKIAESEDIVYTLAVKNEAKKTNAKNVESYFKIPDNLEFKGIRDDATKTPARMSSDKKGVYLTIGDVKAGELVDKDIVFTAKKVKKDESIELAVNIVAENFETVKTTKSLGSTIESEKMSVYLKDVGAEFDPNKVNIYPQMLKTYEVTVRNNTSVMFDEKTKKVIESETFGKVNLSLQLPNTLEYVDTISPLYKVVEYNRVTNLLKIQLLDDELIGGAAVQFNITLKLKDKLPATYNKTVKLALDASSTTLGTKQAVTVRSNGIINYVAEKRLNASVTIYKHNDYNGKPLVEIQEYQDIFIKYSLKPTYLIQKGHFIFEAPAGVKVRAIYKDGRAINNSAVRSALSIGHDGRTSTTYTYAFYTLKDNKIDIFVHAHIEGLGEASAKKLACKIGMKGALQNLSIDVKKGAIHTEIKKLYNQGSLHLSPADKRRFGVGSSGTSTSQNSVLGTTWVDGNKTGIYSTENKALGRVIVELVDNETKKVVARTLSDENGKYQFDNITNGNYSAVFKYNDNKYVPTIYNAQSDLEDNSKGIKVNLESQSGRSIAVTDGIQVNFTSVRNIDLGLVEKSNFDLSLDGEIIEVLIKDDNDKEIKQYNFNDRKTVKVELNKSDLNNAKALVKYKLRVLNEGEVEGNVLKLNAYIPKGMIFDSKLNPLWEVDKEGNVFTTALSANNINPRETQELELILIKEFDKENIGLSIVGLEIGEARNSLGLPDRDSNPNNKNIEEDDYVSLEVILGLNTGKKVAYALLMLTVVSSIGTMVFLVLRKINGKEIK